MQAPHDEGPVPRLTLLLPSSPRGTVGQAFTLGFTLHALTACLAIAALFAFRPSVPQTADPTEPPFPIFIQAPQEPPDEKEPPREALAAGAVPPPPLPPTPAPLGETGRLELTFASDPGGARLREVLERRHGALGFASPAQVTACDTRPSSGSDPGGCYFEYRLRAPYWTPAEHGPFSLEGYFSVRIEPLPLYVRQLRERDAIGRDYHAYALLPDETRLDIDDEIAEQLEKTNGSTLVATRVEITFQASARRGFTLQIVSTKPKAAAAPQGAASGR